MGIDFAINAIWAARTTSIMPLSGISRGTLIKIFRSETLNYEDRFSKIWVKESDP